MSSVDYDSRQNRAGAPRRPPPVAISEPELASPNAARPMGNMAPMPGGHMVLAVGPTALGVVPRLPPAVVGPLVALAGPANRPPLLYTGDATGSLGALRQDVAVSYHAICSALGEPARVDLVNGTLPAAAALGLSIGPPPSSRLPRLTGGAAPLLLLPPPPQPGQPTPTPGQAGSVAMGLGPNIGIEGVGSGADTPARLLTAAGYSSAAGGQLLAGAGFASANPMMGALRSLSAGHGSISGLPPLGLGRGADRNWPLGRPSGAGDVGAVALGGGGGGPRITMLSGFSRPQDSGSDFLGEESAMVYPPPGRGFGGGLSRAALGAPGLAQGQALDAMDDFRFRSGDRKNIRIEDLDDPSRITHRIRRDDDGQLEMFLKEYARDGGKHKAEPAGSSRYRMPF